MQSAQSESIREIGFTAQTSHALHVAGCHTPPAYVIPISTLNTIAEHNNLHSELADVFSHLKQTSSRSSIPAAVETIQEIITEMKIPNDLAKRLLTEHYKLHQGSHVAVRASSILPNDPEDHHAHLHVSGEHSALESALHIWAQMYTERSLPLRQRQFEDGDIIPAAILVQRMIEADQSGVVLTKNPFSNEKRAASQFVVLSRWGVSEHLDHFDSSNLQAYDRFVVDISSMHIVKRHIAEKTDAFQRRPRKLHHHTLQPHQRTKQSLSDAAVRELVSQTLRFKRTQLDQFAVEWARSDGLTYSLSASPVDVTSLRETLTSPTDTSAESWKKFEAHSTATKLLISAGDPHHAEDAIVATDGVGVMQSEYTVLKTGIHPSHLRDEDKLGILQRSFRSAMRDFLEPQQHNRILRIRLPNLTPEERKHLSRSALYEEDRVVHSQHGLRYLIENPAIIESLLSAIAELPVSLQKSVSLLIPEARDPEEIILLHKTIDRYKPSNLISKPDLWLQLDLPYQVRYIKSFLNSASSLAGVSVDLSALTARFRGEDPDHRQSHKEMIDENLAIEIVKDVAGSDALKSLPWQIVLPTPNHRIITLAIDLGVSAVVVPAHQRKKTRECIATAEADRISSPTNTY